MSTCGRLLNDVRGFGKESNEGKLNIISLHIIHRNSFSYDDVVKERVNPTITNNTRDLLKLVSGRKDSLVPWACRDLFWDISTVLQFFYLKNCSFTSHEIANSVVKALLAQPIIIVDN